MPKDRGEWGIIEKTIKGTCLTAIKQSNATNSWTCKYHCVEFRVRTKLFDGLAACQFLETILEPRNMEKNI